MPIRKIDIMKNIFKVLAFFTLLASTSASYAGFAIGATRVIFHEGSKEASLQISNTDSSPVLIQSWIDKDEKSQKSHFMVIPPLVLLNNGDKTDLRIIYTGQPLPQDRESLSWVNIKSIPNKADDDENKNVLQIAVKSRLKIMYRPKAFKEVKFSEESKKLNWSINNNQLFVNNPTPYYMNFASINVNNEKVEPPLFVAPFGTKTYPIKARNTSGKVSWSVINDYGATTPLLTANLNY